DDDSLDPVVLADLLQVPGVDRLDGAGIRFERRREDLTVVAHRESDPPAAEVDPQQVSLGRDLSGSSVLICRRGVIAHRKRTRGELKIVAGLARGQAHAVNRRTVTGFATAIGSRPT